MNWYRCLDDLDALNLNTLQSRDFFTRDQALKAIASYNSALNLMLHKKYSKAEEILRRLNKEYASFVEARYLYGVLKCINNNHAAGQELFEQSRYMAESPYWIEKIDLALGDVSAAAENQKAQKMQRRRTEEIMHSILASKSEHKILRYVPDLKKQHYKIADKNRKEELKKGEICVKPRYFDPKFVIEDRKKTIRFFAYIASASLFVILIFSFLVVPEIKNRRKIEKIKSDKLFWLEENLRSRASESSDIYQLLLDYNSYIDYYFAKEGAKDTLQDANAKRDIQSYEHSDEPGGNTDKRPDKQPDE